MPFERRGFEGGAVATSILGSITALSTSWAIADATGWPDGTNGEFYAVLNRAGSTSNPQGTAPEEKVLVLARSGTTLTLADSSKRGVDGTTAQAWDPPTTIAHCGTATDLDEANDTASQTLGQVQAKGDLLVGSGANTLLRVPGGSDGQFVVYDSTQAAGVTPSAIPDAAISSPTMFADNVLPLTAIADGVITDAKLAHHYYVSLTSTSVNLDATGVWNAFNWTVVEDADSLFTAGSPGIITVPTGGAGLWTFEYGVRWSSNATGTRQIRLVCSTAGTLNLGVAAAGNTVCVVTASKTVRLIDGETISAERFQNSGGNLALAPAEGLHYLTARQLRIS